MSGFLPFKDKTPKIDASAQEVAKGNVFIVVALIAFAGTIMTVGVNGFNNSMTNFREMGRNKAANLMHYCKLVTVFVCILMVVAILKSFKMF